MKRSTIISQIISLMPLLVGLWLGTTKLPDILADEPDAEQLIREFKGEAEPGKRTPQEMEAAYVRVIESLLPKMGSDNLEEQKASQQTFQEICWRAGRPGAEVERAAVCKAIAARLSAAVPPAARVWLLKQLEYIGREEVVGALTGLLKDQDPLIRERARRALENNPSLEAASSLRSALEKAESADWRIALINALGCRRDKAGAPLLIKEAGSDDENVRCAAMEALARIGDKAAANVIAAGMDKGSQRARNAAADSYLVLAHALCREDDKAAALEMFRRLLGSEGRLRCAAVIGLAQAGGIQELPAIMGVLADGDTGRLAIYFGGADTVIALAFAQVDELIQYVKDHSKV